jgi:antitoxin ParD1/3/4
MARHATTMSFSLPKPLHDYVKQRARDAHYGTPSDYIRSLIREDIKRMEQERLEYELLKGVQSKSRVITPQEWDKLKKDIVGDLKNPPPEGVDLV